MMRLTVFLLLISFTSCNFEDKTSTEANSEEITTYYFIRHAEKDVSNPENDDPELRKQGWERAENWAEFFQEIPLDLVYASQYKRTQQTAKPTAEAHNLPINLYSTSKLNDKAFQQKTKGKSVLVVGHSDITPEFVNYILEEDKYEDIEKDEFGSLIMVTISPKGKKTSRIFYVN